MISKAHVVLASAVLTAVALSGCLGGGEDSGGGVPTAVLAITAGDDARSFILDGSGSSDPDGDALTYVWNWVVGAATTTESMIEVEFPEGSENGNAALLATLMVEDPHGNMGVSAPKSIVFGDGNNDVPEITLADAARYVQPNVETILDASETSDPNGDALFYQWYWGPRDVDVESAEAGHEHGGAGSGACPEVKTAVHEFSSDCMEQGQTYNITFDKPGTWTLHCHPHPWMKMVVKVDPSGANTTAREIDIANYRFSEKEITIGVGTQVTWTNKDPVVHTVTTEDYTPGMNDGGTDPVFRETLPEGEYIVRFVATDVFGGRASETWGVKVGPDAPPIPDVRTCESPENEPLVQGDHHTTCYYNTTYPYQVEAVLEWENNGVAANTANLTLFTVDSEGDTSQVTNCPAVPGEADETNKVYLSCRLGARDHLLRVTATGGVITSWTLEVTGVPFSFPDFGDSAGGGHQH